MREIKRVENALGTKLDRSLQQMNDKTKPERETQQKLMTTLAATQQQMEQSQRTLMQALNNLQRDMHTLVPAFSKVVEEKVTKLALASVEKACDSMAPRLEAVAREAVAATVTQQVAASSQVSAEAVKASVAASTQAAFRANFQEIVVPQFERAVATMLRQVSQNLDKGLRESLQSYRDSLRVLADKQTEQISLIAKQQLQRIVPAEAAAEQMKAGVQALVELTQNVSGSIIEMQKRVFTSQQDVPRIGASETQPPEHVSPVPPTRQTGGFGGVFGSRPAAAATAAAHAPLPPPDPYSQIATALSGGQYELAFQVALNQASLEVVVWLCKQVDMSKVSQSKQLTPLVLLALIQQLGYDLASHTELKVTWLRELLLVDYKEAFANQHARPILAKLQQNITDILPQITDQPTSTGLVVLRHIITSMLSRT